MECNEHSKTGSAAILKTYLLAINLSDPEGDAHERMFHGDYRVISIGEIGPTFPGIQSSESYLVCKLGHQFIEGTSDGLEGREHMRLQAFFGKYATKSNRVVAENWKGYWENAAADASLRASFGYALRQARILGGEALVIHWHY